MSKPKQANITRRLMLGFLTLISIFLLFGVFTLYYIDRVSDLSRTIHNHPLVVSNAALQANVSIVKMHRNMKDVVLFHSSSRIQQFIEAVNEEEEQVYRHLNIVKNNILGEKGKVLENEARNLFDKWRPIRNEVIGLVNNDQREKAANITIGKGANHVALLELKMLGLTNYARNKASEFKAETERLNSRLNVALILFLLLSILVSILVAFFTLKQIGSAENELKNSQERYRSLVENQTDLVCRFIHDGTLVFVNDAYCHFFEKTKDELVGKKWHPLPVDNDVRFIQEKLTTLSPSNPTVVVENRIFSGKRDIHWMQFVNRGFFDRSGNLQEIQSVGRDITERKQAETALMESLAKYRQIYENIQDVYYETSLDGKILEISPSIRGISQYTRKDLIGKSLFDIYADPEQRKEIVKIILEKDKVNDFEIALKDKDGSQHPCSVKAVLIKDDQGNPIKIVGSLRDIFDRKQAEKEKAKIEVQLQQSQKLKSIGTLAGGVAHEINNPINSIMNYAQLIIDKIDTENPAAEFAGEIIHETERVATIVRNLLTFAREEKETHSPARLKDIIDNTMSLIQTVFKRDQILLKVDVAEDLPKILCRSQQIRQVIMNLAINARDALNERYPGYDEKKLIKITSNLFKKEGKRWIRTTVEDHGVGISSDIKKRIFDPFFTTKDRTVGTGLGLSISYSIVKEHHGELSFESNPGEYTRFHMDLPVDNGWDLEKNGRN